MVSWLIIQCISANNFIRDKLGHELVLLKYIEFTRIVISLYHSVLSPGGGGGTAIYGLYRYVPL